MLATPLELAGGVFASVGGSSSLLFNKLGL